MTARNRLLENHSLVVRDGRVLAILPSAEAADAYAACVVLERPAHLLMPGLVNAHTQAATSLFRGFADGLGLGPSLDAGMRPPERRLVGPEFVRDGVLLCIADMIKSGITCFADGYCFPDETARAAASQGMRAVVGLPVSERPGPWAQSADDYLRRALCVRDEYRDHPLITTVFAPQPPAAISDATFGRIATLADELDAGIMIRLHESAAAIEESTHRYGLRPIERLQRLGLLTPALNAVYMAHLDGADIELAQRGGISVSLCPQSCLKRGQRLPQIGALAAAGIRVGLGSDGSDTHDARDIWLDMKLLTAAGSAHEATSTCSAWDALAAATRGGAAALGRDTEIGTLEPGKWADLCCVDLGGPALQPLYHPVGQLVVSGGRDCVTDVWVAGRQLLSNGALTRLDWPGVAARANAWAARLTSEELP
jgi:5-methylthioadenosine/S-adenosylhomocysteine deaminase